MKLKSLLIIILLMCISCTLPVQIIEPKENGIKASIEIEYRDLIWVLVILVII